MSDSFADILKSDITYEVLLPVYYKQDVEFEFVNAEGKNSREVFNIKMIPDTGDFFDKRVNQIREKMNDRGYNVISIDKVGDYIQMTDKEVDDYIKFGYIELQINDWWRSVVGKPTESIITDLASLAISQLFK